MQRGRRQRQRRQRRVNTALCQAGTDGDQAIYLIHVETVYSNGNDGIIWNYMELYGFIWIYVDLFTVLCILDI